MSSITPPAGAALRLPYRSVPGVEARCPVVAWDIEALHNGDFILAFSL